MSEARFEERRCLRVRTEVCNQQRSTGLSNRPLGRKCKTTPGHGTAAWGSFSAPRPLRRGRARGAHTCQEEETARRKTALGLRCRAMYVRWAAATSSAHSAAPGRSAGACAHIRAISSCISMLGTLSCRLIRYLRATPTKISADIHGITPPRSSWSRAGLRTAAPKRALPVAQVLQTPTSPSRRVPETIHEVP